MLKKDDKKKKKKKKAMRITLACGFFDDVILASLEWFEKTLGDEHHCIVQETALFRVLGDGARTRPRKLCTFRENIGFQRLPVVVDDYW